MKKTIAVVVLLALFALVAVQVADFANLWGNRVPTRSRREAIPVGAVKGTPQTDRFPPVLHSDEWEAPVPMPGPVNTAGAEDSPFMTPDGQRFFFFFIPDVRVPAEKQLIDGVTGIWWTRKVGDNRTEPERIILNKDVSLDGAEFVQGDTMWFGSVRVGNYREIDVYTAQFRDGKWTDVANAGKVLNVDYDIGEFAFSPDGNTLYYGAGDGNRDIWVLEKTNGSWGNRRRVTNINSDLNEDQPFVTPDGKELWFTGQSRKGYPGPAVFRSVRNGTQWGPPTEILSRFAGEPVLDAQGNIYFVHHFYSENGTMIEADIYVAYRRSSLNQTEQEADTLSQARTLDDHPVLLAAVAEKPSEQAISVWH